MFRIQNFSFLSIIFLGDKYSIGIRSGKQNKTNKRNVSFLNVHKSLFQKLLNLHVSNKLKFEQVRPHGPNTIINSILSYCEVVI